MIEVLLWLFVIKLGIAFSAGLYESRISVPQWLSFSRDTGYEFLAWLPNHPTKRCSQPLPVPMCSFQGVSSFQFAATRTLGDYVSIRSTH
jgi:hypothetical protein